MSNENGEESLRVLGARVPRSMTVSAVVCALSVLVAGCTALNTTSTGVAEVQVGESVDCPGEFLEYLAKERTLAGLTATVEEDHEGRTDPELEFALHTQPICVVVVQGNRALPSGNTEPAEYVHLIPGTHADNIAAAAHENEYIDAAGGLLVRDEVMISLLEKDAEQLGIPGEDQYTLLTASTSAELARLRTHPSQNK